MEKEQAPQFEIRTATVDDVVEIRAMQAQSWRDTYCNDDLGVTEEWLTDETENWLTPEKLAVSKEWLGKVFSDPSQFYRVAYRDGKAVGLLHLSTREDGVRRLEGLYTASETHGMGLAQQLMVQAEEFMGNGEVELEVASYNERAKVFYRKYGFEETDKMNSPYRGKIPSTTMIRKGDAQ